MEQIVFIEFQNGKPFAVITHDGMGEEHYNIEWCERDGSLYYDNSGSGPATFEFKVYKDCDFWIAEHLQAVTAVFSGTFLKKNPVEKTMEIPEEYSGELGNWASEERTEYCTVCKDHLPTNNLCGHIYWSNSGWYSGAGCDDGERESEKNSLFAVLDKTGIAKELRKALSLQSYKTSFYGDIFGWDGIDCLLNGVCFGHRFTDNLTHDEESRMSDGVGWLMSLETNVTIDAEKLTIQWIDEYLKEKKKILFRKFN